MIFSITTTSLAMIELHFFVLCTSYKDLVPLTLILNPLDGVLCQKVIHNPID